MNTEEELLASDLHKKTEMTEGAKAKLRELEEKIRALPPQPIRIASKDTEMRIIPPSLNLTEESLDAIRAIVREEHARVVYVRIAPGDMAAIHSMIREEMAAFKQAIVDGVLKVMEIDIRLGAGMISANEARQQLGLLDEVK